MSRSTGDNKYFNTDMSKPIADGGLEDGRNTFTVRDLLDRCEPRVRYEEISELGAAIEVQFVWDCNVNRDKCVPHIQARRVDSIFDPNNIGFKFSYPRYTGVDKRNLITVRGIRFYIRTLGTGQMVSISAIILKVSTGLTLLGLAPIIADLMMIKCFKGRSELYNARKYDVSPDFSDIFDKQDAEAKLKGEEEVVEEDEEDYEELNWRKRMDEEEEGKS